MFQGEADDAAAMDLVYTTNSSCHLITELSGSNTALETLLLPASTAFQGNLRVSKAASGDGCALYVAIKTDSELYDVYKVAQSVQYQLKELFYTKGLENVALARATAEVGGNKLLAASLSTVGLNETSKSVLTIEQGACVELRIALKKAEGDFGLLPRQVETNAVDIVDQSGIDVNASCAVKLDIAAPVPCLSVDGEVFQLLKVVNEKIDLFFAGQPDTMLVGANVQLLVASVEQKESIATASEDAITLTLNAPSYEEAMGIFALIAVLVVMLMGVIVQKKWNDKHSRDRYERASRAAQIRRVSIRMSQHDQENQEDEGEEDNLL